MFRAGLYARVSTNDQQTVPLQIRALREYAVRRGWTIALQVKEVGSGASQRQLPEKLLEAARRRRPPVELWPGCSRFSLSSKERFCGEQTRAGLVSGPAERQTTWPAVDGGTPSCRNRETALRRHQQIRDRPAVRNPYLGPPDFSRTYFPEE